MKHLINDISQGLIYPDPNYGRDELAQQLDIGSTDEKSLNIVRGARL
jgi:hypothetical protein